MKNNITEIEVKYKLNGVDTKRVKISKSQDAYEAFIRNWNLDTIELLEEFKVLLLNRANEVLGIYVVGKGGITGVSVDIRLLFAVVLKSCSTAIITCHNHPSGNLKPSKADTIVYDKVKKVAKTMDISLLDNLIISKVGFYSFQDNLK